MNGEGFELRERERGRESIRDAPAKLEGSQPLRSDVGPRPPEQPGYRE